MLENIPHALILESCRGFGIQEVKEVCTQILGKEHEKKIKKNIHPDVYFVCKKEKNSVGINEIRFLIRDCFLNSYESGKKIYIIKNSDKMTFQAQNALLKILEEPPENVYFILLCENHRNLLPTIISRLCFLDKENFDIKSKDIIDEKSLKSESEILDFVKAVSGNDDYEIIKILNKFSKNREILKKFLISLKIKIISSELSCDEKLINICEKINYVIKLIDRNVNLSLALCLIV
ncbi:MAG: hypothetical protein CfP315_0422 [Candidatus Improbicoccus pseudotrichonymphae]|uniref:DNA polymerase III subunit delta n=1 Tax=Candidatus Improbicoccus pseudotrichonymphae TaxID=3033792 RepID=A0AA48IAG9_9FIRM|nr:MAG: hypothetical protein CfP315_0422 [Candidatus Improbicoccus pseudotrichonymphae]